MNESNTSGPEVGLDDPAYVWLRRRVRVPSHPEWGDARVLRWYPSTERDGERLRIFTGSPSTLQVVWIKDVEVI